jgi:hypothetical protein
MAMTREFLGWDAPILPNAAQRLWSRFGQSLGEVAVVLPTARAGRRLSELLVEAAVQESATDAGGAVILPTLLRPGQLPAHLLDLGEVADTVTSRWAWSESVRRCGDRLGDSLGIGGVRVPGEPWPATRCWAVGRELGDLWLQLGVSGKGFDQVERALPASMGEHSRDAQRWRSVAEIAAVYFELLKSLGHPDCDAARWRAVREQRWSQPPTQHGSVILLGVIELPELLRELLQRYVQEQGRVEVWIAAPQAESECFDAWGALCVEAWEERRVVLDDARLIVVDRPADQQRAVVEAIADSGVDAYSDVTVGVADATLEQGVARAIQRAGGQARPATGRPMTQSRPARLLEACADFAQQPDRFDVIATLLRHPDVPLHATHESARSHWLELLDRYWTDHAQGRPVGDWLGTQGQQLRLAYDAILQWLGGGAMLRERRPLREWVEPIRNILLGAYADRNWNPDDPQQAPVAEALSAIAQVLQSTALLPAQPEEPGASLGDAMRWVLQNLSDTALDPPEVGRGAVEVVGFLELPWDDARCVVLCGVNEGALPSSVNADAWLPDSLREKLGLACNRSRLVRDMYLLTLITQSRPETVLIAGRRDMQGDPLMPSRLWLRDEPTVLAQRLSRFYDEVTTASGARLDTAGVTQGPSRLLIPTLPTIERLQEVQRQLRVTAFGDYLRCPYRFYLKHVLGLRGIDDRSPDLSPQAFGTLLHDVLQHFAKHGPTGSASVEQIEAFVIDTLYDKAQQRHGRSPQPAVRLQLQLVEQRLMSFAAQQAQLVREGWRIVPEHAEKDLVAALDAPGGPFTLTGRIDRIDHHPRLGYRLIDYKTGDAGDEPLKAHFNARDGWTNLQLPLYTLLAESAGMCDVLDAGYFVLPRKQNDAGYKPMDWGRAPLDDAIDKAREVIANLRAALFWPPKVLDESTLEHDEFAGVVYAGVHDWDALRDMSAAHRQGGEA